jgi:hypothetical protein
MNVTQYTFQSPYSSPVQVGRPDPSSKQETSAQPDTSGFVKSINTSLSDAKSFQATQTQEVKPTVDTGSNIDIYA